MKHFLSCYVRYDSFPFCNGLQLVTSQFLACPTFETESREKIFAHYHMLQRGRFRKDEDEIFTISYSNRITQIIPPCDPGYFLPYDKNRTTRIICTPAATLPSISLATGDASVLSPRIMRSAPSRSEKSHMVNAIDVFVSRILRVKMTSFFLGMLLVWSRTFSPLAVNSSLRRDFVCSSIYWGRRIT